MASSDQQKLLDLIPALRAFARTWYRDPTDADDLVQETLTRALGAIHQFQTGTSMKSWMFTIMRNTFMTGVKKYNRERPGATDCVAGMNSLDATQEWSVRGNEIQSAIAQLPQNQREVITLVAMLGLEYEEAAEICNVPIGTIKSRLSRGRVNLLVALGERSTSSAVESLDAKVSYKFAADQTRH